MDDEDIEQFFDHPFTCPKCGRTSFNPNDARNRYCGACHKFFEGEER